MSQLEKSLMEIFGEVIPKENERESLIRFLELIRSADKEVRVVAGELRPSFYNAELAETIRQKIKEKPNFKFYFLYSKDKDIETAIEMTKKDNEALAVVFSDFSENVIVYCATRRPTYHFSTIDNWIFMEEKHEQGAERKVFIQKNEKLAKEYDDIFENMIAPLDSPIAIRVQPIKFKIAA